MSKKHLVNLLQEWMDKDHLMELSNTSHVRYQSKAHDDAKFHDTEGTRKIHDTWSGDFNDTGDESKGDADYAKRDKRERGITRSKKLVKKQALLKPVQMVAKPSLSQRIKKSMGFSDK